MMKKDEKILQFRIALLEVEPEVWRRIQVPAWYSMWDLHVAIQDAMGWLDSHLHSFSFPGRFGDGDEFGIPHEDSLEMEDIGIRTLAGWLYAAERVFETPGTMARYLYDFGDSWMHEVTFEGSMPAEKDIQYPRCIEGAQPCPPEDCGGPHLYPGLLEAIANPDSDDAADLAEWLDGEVTRYLPFVPGRFDLAEIVFDDPNERWRFAFGDGDRTLLTGPPRDEDFRPPAFPLPGTIEDEAVEMIDAISYNTGTYARSAVEYIIRNSALLLPLLLDMLVEAAEDPDGILEEPEYIGHVYALMLLGHLRETEAHRIMAEIAYLPDGMPHELFGDSVTETFPAVLQRTCAGNYDTIHEIARSARAEIYVRAAAIDAIQYGVLTGEYAREDALRFFAEILDACTPEVESFFPSHIAASMVDLHPGGYVEPIRRVFEEGIVEEGYMGWEEVLVAADMDVDDCLARLRKQFMPRYLDDIHASMEWWACFNEEAPFPAFQSSRPLPAASKKKKSRRKQEKKARKKNRKK